MRLRQLDAFRSTVALGSVSAAATRLGISQPNVTRLLADLERSVGFTLFARHRRGVTPTAEGLAFHAVVERSLTGLEVLRNAADRIREGVDNRLELGVSAAMAMDFVPRVVASLASAQPGLRVSLHVSDSTRLLERLRVGRVAMVVLSPEQTPAGVNIVLERSFPYVAVMNRHHPLAQRRGRLHVGLLTEGEVIAPDPGFLAAKCAVPDVAERLVEMSTTTAEVSYAAVALVRHGLGIALVDPFTAASIASDEQLVVKPFRDAPRFDLVIASAQWLPLTEAQRLFAAAAADALDHVGPRGSQRRGAG